MPRSTSMQDIWDFALRPDQAALWFLGQSGFVIRDAETTVVIDPYLSDSVSTLVPELVRLYPPPIRPDELRADVLGSAARWYRDYGSRREWC